MDVSRDTDIFLRRCHQLPHEAVLTILKTGTNSTFLDALASAALDSAVTERIFTAFEPLALEICARWENAHPSLAIPALGRIVATIPYLGEIALHLLRGFSTKADLIGSLLDDNDSITSFDTKAYTAREVLLGLHRLLKIDNKNTASLIRPAKLQFLLKHEDRSVRYLAIRVLCQYIHASDATLEDMFTKFLGSEPVTGKWEDKTIDYMFLTLWERKRLDDFRATISSCRQERSLPQVASQPKRVIEQDDLQPVVLLISGVLLLRSSQSAVLSNNLTTFTNSVSAKVNLNSFANALLDSQPILVTGLPSSGKTTLVRHLAARLNKSTTMVTLHLNEQSDAKLLVGIYSTGAQPGSFEWKPGVLTNAVRQGRWLFIEDIDRAPNEVMSVLLPLMERGELSIPSRGEKLQAAQGFRIIATMRSTINLQGEEVVPTSRMLGARLWKQVSVKAPDAAEISSIIAARHPLLAQYMPRIMAVFQRLENDTRHASIASQSTSSRMRSISVRELFSWCGRLSDRFRAAGLKTGHEQVSEAVMDAMFLDAVDCFTGNLERNVLSEELVSALAEELHIAPQRKEYLLKDRRPGTKIVKSGTRNMCVVGRALLSMHSSNTSVAKDGQAPSAAPFALNGYSLRLLEQVAVAVQRREPLLLVGETGIGKTTAIQHLAQMTGQHLLAINLSQQSESGDLLGGFKPVNLRSIIIPMKDDFDVLFSSTFSSRKNERFMEVLTKNVVKSSWRRVVGLWKEALQMAENAFSKAEKENMRASSGGGEQPSKKRKIGTALSDSDRQKWTDFAGRVAILDTRLTGSSDSQIFTFSEGKLVKAVRDGHWVLLDEVNLATPDTLECLVELLDSGPDAQPSILLAESGNIERIEAHPDFRVFAAMNPATDVGKKDLPIGVRSRFTEIYVNSPDTDAQSLQSIVRLYLDRAGPSGSDKKLILSVTELYQEIQRTVQLAGLVDGAGQRPHYSLRTLTRALAHAVTTAPRCTLRRALFEGFSMCFFTFLDRASEEKLRQLVTAKLFPSQTAAVAELKKPLRQPDDNLQYVTVEYFVEAIVKGGQRKKEQHWVPRGQCLVENPSEYIVTPYIAGNLRNVIRAVSTRKHPILIQGPTSAGKTSMVEYLAKRSGNKFVRINNHEHTDLQEYLGTYISTGDGQLVFQEGVLVQAVRAGHWVVLDELNLAPTDVLEALNRLLDDNRELLIPETQEIVRPHPDFRLFATQNPVGPYGGRKVLSRAFRNRFLELHFDDIPVEELNIILSQRSQLPASRCALIVDVYKRLSQVRQEQRLFEQHSFATLRDLFRWAFRGANTVEELADNGYMLLAEKVRKTEDRLTVKEVIETVMSKKGVKIHISEDLLYSDTRRQAISPFAQTDQNGIVWTKAMRRLFVLVAQAVQKNEAVLLVGETGCGKTTVCQLLAQAMQQRLHIVNAHQNTETGDLIGAQRPVRGRAVIEQTLLDDLRMVLGSADRDAYISLDEMLKDFDALTDDALQNIPTETRLRIKTNRTRNKALFEWSDGSLVEAMRAGQFYLLDEISLADDSVLERMNSVLDPQRSILLAEKGTEDSFVIAKQGFQFFATMNPGGDFGKKELSPALRNRFTELWVPPMTDAEDVLQIVLGKLKPSASSVSQVLVSFAQWFGQRFSTHKASTISIRDILTWVSFINTQDMDVVSATVHGAALVYIDTLGANPAALLAVSGGNIMHERRQCLKALGEQLGHDAFEIYSKPMDIAVDIHYIRFGHFRISRSCTANQDSMFTFNAPTTKLNAMRIVRAMQLSKPVLLEGSPGVGKTSIITAISKSAGRPLTRMNLSEQTDLMDLFGSDVPVEDGEPGHFAWKDAPFLAAMKRGDWVLLDEMNLASQSVLEGLNACLDHRGEVYVAELNQTFSKHPDFRLFAAQNPHHQGGGRKGLPASFVNRFTVVFVDMFQQEDLRSICCNAFPSMSSNFVDKLVAFVVELNLQVTDKRSFGARGSPWEFNLRDTLRWLQLLTSSNGLLPAGNARDYLEVLFKQRFRTSNDAERVQALFEEIFEEFCRKRDSFTNLTNNSVQIGLGLVQRRPRLQNSLTAPAISMMDHLPILESLLICVQQNWPVILVGSSGVGKSSLLQAMASLVGVDLEIFSLNADIDATDLVGGYEQSDPSRQVYRLLKDVENTLRFTAAEARTDAIAVPIGGLYAQLLELIDYVQKLEMANVDLIELHKRLSSLSDYFDVPDLSALLQRTEALIQKPQGVNTGRFEWTNGTLVNALEQGQWLVLDNANLCSSSVLDRLNSLLEPEGALIVSEHSLEDGSPRVVRPHPNFRIFLTMDPQYGDVSRAMRNRAVELYVAPLGEQEQKTNIAQEAMLLESRLFRHQQFVHVCNQTGKTDLLQEPIVQAAFEALSFSDMRQVQSFHQQAEQGLLSSKAQLLLANAVSSYMEMTRMNESWQPVSEEFYKSVFPLHSIGYADVYHFQSINTLVNQPFVALAARSSSPPSSQDPFWLADVHGVLLNVARMKQALIFIRESTSSTKIMTRLERSFAHSRLPDVAKESTYRVAPFLNNVLVSIVSWTKTAIQQAQNDQTALDFVKSVCRFWSDLFSIASSPQFQEAHFQVLLSLGSRLISKSRMTVSSMPEIVKHVDQHLKIFRSSAQLTSGFSMEQIWTRCRSTPFSDTQQLDMITKLEELADQFDDLLWALEAPLEELFTVRQSIAQAIDTVRRGAVEGSNFVQDLEVMLAQLSASRRAEANAFPYFTTVFEALSQYADIDDEYADEHAARISFLALRRTKQLHIPPHWQSSAQALAKITRYTGPPQQLQGQVAASGGISALLLQHLSDVDEIALKRQSLLREEFRLLGLGLARSEPSIAADQTHKILAAILPVALDIIKMHDELSNTDHGAANLITGGTSSLMNIVSKSSTDHESRAVADILQRNFEPLLELGVSAQNAHIERRMLGSALVKFAIGCVLLYVPNRSFDPALRAQMEQQSRTKRLQDLTARLEALSITERYTTGQLTNMRYDVTRREIESLEDLPAVTVVVRPSESRLDDLQVEFSNILRLVERLQHDNSEGSELGDTAIRGISRLISNLQNDFRTYEDITLPIVGFLSCMKLGLHLFRSGEHTTSTVETQDRIFHMIPFGDIKPSYATNSSNSIQSSVLQLQIMAAIASVSDIRTWRDSYHITVMRSLDFIFGQWQAQLSDDQKQAAANSSIYHYKGSAEDEEEVDEEEYNDLFPTFEEEKNTTEDNTKSAKQAVQPQKYAATLARLHSKIFQRPGTPEHELEDSLKAITKSTRRQSAIDAPEFSSENPAKELPAIFLTVRNLNGSLKAEEKVSNNYNVYTDANVGEAQRISRLVEEVQACFRPIVEIWPEHATLHNILAICDELLAFRHVDPVMKILTKAEKLHDTIDQWQKVASREYSRPDLFNKLTDIIISWRQLELSTWAKLLDLETEKSEEGAQSWWFIAYESVIAGLTSSTSSADTLRQHTIELIATLEVFIRNSTVGQFETRIRLLSSLVAQLELHEKSTSTFREARIALTSFIKHFERFVSPIADVLAKGRAKLEKAVRDVVQLASWKDRNINTLKQSAKSSHRKLFRIIRKFRVLLAQPATPILSQELPTTPVGEVGAAVAYSAQSDGVFDTKAPSICQSSEALWAHRPTRFRDVISTASMIRSIASAPERDTDGGLRLRDFTESLQVRITHLQKATPGTLTKENENAVKNITAQKRRLFAETLKDVREMGMRNNISEDVLATQNSLAVVLCRAPLLEGIEDFKQAAMAQDCTHRLLDIMPGVRATISEHNDDLNQSEVVRSVAYMESFLQLCLKQRQDVSRAMDSFTKLNTSLTQLQNLWLGDNCQAVPETPTSKLGFTAFTDQVTWLPHVIRLGTKILNAQAELGELDFAGLLTDLAKWAQTFEQLKLSLSGLPVTPNGLLSVAQAALVLEYQTKARAFQACLREKLETCTHGKVVIEHILQWTCRSQSADETDKIKSDESTRRLHEAIKEQYAAFDMILGSIQDVSSAQKRLAENIDVPSWLIKEETAQSSVLNAFHAETIAEAINKCLAALSRIQPTDPADLELACASFTMSLPILQQYVSTYHNAISPYADLHSATCETTYRLAKTLILVASQGFCRPAEKSDEKANASDKLEAGTGLGEGEGAEDISKDIGADEDLDDLAQDVDETGKDREMQKADDAVEIEDELEGGGGAETKEGEEEEGEMGEKGEKEDEDGDEGEVGSTGGGDAGEEGDDEAAMDEDVGSVDDLGPSAVDEKLWDQAGDEDAKEKEGEQDSKQNGKDEQTAAGREEKGKKDNNDTEAAEDGQNEEDAGSGADEEMSDFGSEVGSAGEPDVMDPHMKETEGLDLPEDLQLDGDKGKNDDDAGEDDDLDGLDELDKNNQEEQGGDEDEVMEENLGDEATGDDEQPGDLQQDMADPADDDKQPDPLPQPSIGGPDNDAVQLMDEQQGGGQANDTTNEEREQDTNTDNNIPAAEPQDPADADPSTSAASAQQTSGAQSNNAQEDQLQPASQQQQSSQQPQQPQRGESKDTQALRKLGNLLEQWHRQHREILEAPSEPREKPQPEQQDVDMKDTEFEHIPEDAEGDAQALGKSNIEQARALDESMAVEHEETVGEKNAEQFLPDEEEDQDDDADGDAMDVDTAEDADAAAQSSRTDPTNPSMQQEPQSFVSTQRLPSRADLPSSPSPPLSPSTSPEDDLNPIAPSLSTLSLSPASLDPAARWNHHTQRTSTSALLLTEHLRLILAPTHATRLRGDFRTGKRLNMKRVIPYIASGYKRDRIWLRRSAPSKRQYQILLALDDSKSMIESGTDDTAATSGKSSDVDRDGITVNNPAALAFDTLALLSRALTSLESGDLGVLAFGSSVTIAHELGQPFSGDAGPNTLGHFTFTQTKTDVRELISRSIEIFREARSKQQGGSGEELWQLELVVSDGICEDHEGIRRLLVQAREERIMVVFIIVDAANTGTSQMPSTSSTAQATKKSILDLERVEFIQTPSTSGDDADAAMKIVRKKYLETFPFGYYLVVKDVRELPGVLATALRQWFAEVNNSTGG